MKNLKKQQKLFEAQVVRVRARARARARVKPKVKVRVGAGVGVTFTRQGNSTGNIYSCAQIELDF
jgi:hypothetical protein